MQSVLRDRSGISLSRTTRGPDPDSEQTEIVASNLVFRSNRRVQFSLAARRDVVRRGPEWQVSGQHEYARRLP
jgi:hypothetical protein